MECDIKVDVLKYQKSGLARERSVVVNEIRELLLYEFNANKLITH